MSESKPSELPSWLEDNEDEPTLSFNHATKKVESSESKQKSDHNNNTLLLGTTDTERKKQWVYWGFKVLTIGICMLMLTTAVLSMAQADSISYSGKIMTAVYMIIFTLLLLVFEIAELQQVVFVEHFYHRNFGFLFKPKGKSLFIIFIAFLSFGLSNPEALCITNGLAWVLVGGGELAVYLKFPEYFETGEK